MTIIKESHHYSSKIFTRSRRTQHVETITQQQNVQEGDFIYHCKLLEAYLPRLTHFLAALVQLSPLLNPDASDVPHALRTASFYKRTSKVLKLLVLKKIQASILRDIQVLLKTIRTLVNYNITKAEILCS